MAAHRRVVLEPVVEEYLKSEVKRFPRIWDIYHALEYRLEQEPDPTAISYPVTHLSQTHYLIRSLPFRLPFPCFLVLLYRISDEGVFVEFARVETAGDVDN